MKHYEQEFKTKVINAVKSGLSISDAAKTYKVTPTSVRVWTRFTSKAEPASTANPSVSSDLIIHSLRSENSRLKLAVADLYLQSK